VKIRQICVICVPKKSIPKFRDKNQLQLQKIKKSLRLSAFAAKNSNSKNLKQKRRTQIIKIEVILKIFVALRLCGKKNLKIKSLFSNF